MNCMNCGAFLTDRDLDYCPHCGCNVLIQKKADYLSRQYYNLGLEKASVRDLSGAISCLKQSLIYSKYNIQARNLLGLVYFETGEVVAALSEWVISKNLQPSRNLASEYINKLQANSNKLEVINETIRKYNEALNLCREGHEDMAAIRLKKILSQNPKLIKGYHLLALIRIKEGEYNKARRTLKKAARIDQTNTTTLRFLKEIEEQTGVSTKLGRQNKGLFRNGDETGSEKAGRGPEMMVQAPAYRERSRVSLFFTLVAGFVAGLLAFYLLAVPAIRQRIYREANQQIVSYSDAVSSQGAELTKAQSQVKESDDTVEAASAQIAQEQKKSSTYQALLEAYAAYKQQNMDEAALKLQNVYFAGMDAVGSDANKKYEDYLYDAANKKDIDKNQKSYSNTFFFAEQSNKYFDSWTSLVGADGYTPIAGSPLLGAASFAGWTGFDTVTYIGAFDGSNNWMSGWTNFDPQNAKY